MSTDGMGDTQGAKGCLDDLLLQACRLAEVPVAIAVLRDAARCEVDPPGLAVWVEGGGTLLGGCWEVIGATSSVLPDEVMLVGDLRTDRRFAGVIRGEAGVRFFARFPLMTPAGDVLGSLYLFGAQSRILVPECVGAVRDVSRRLVAQVTLQREFGDLVVSSTKDDAEELEAVVARCAGEARGLAALAEAAAKTPDYSLYALP